MRQQDLWNTKTVSEKRLDVSALENYLWDAACVIRGPLDAPITSRGQVFIGAYPGLSSFRPRSLDAQLQDLTPFRSSQRSAAPLNWLVIEPAEETALAYAGSATASQVRYGPSWVINTTAIRVVTTNPPNTGLYEPVESNPIPISGGPMTPPNVNAAKT
jgi:hypothetical protein